MIHEFTSGSRCWEKSAGSKLPSAYRIEPYLCEDLAGIDNRAAIPYLSDAADEHFRQWKSRHGLLSDMIAKMFRFSMTRPPVYMDGKIGVYGRVVCTWEPPEGQLHPGQDTREYQGWCGLLEQLQLQVLVSGHYVGMITSDVGSCWQCPATFELASRDTEFAVEIRSMAHQHHVLESPFRLDELLWSHNMGTDFLAVEDSEPNRLVPAELGVFESKRMRYTM